MDLFDTWLFFVSTEIHKCSSGMFVVSCSGFSVCVRTSVTMQTVIFFSVWMWTFFLSILVIFRCTCARVAALSPDNSCFTSRLKCGGFRCISDHFCHPIILLIIIMFLIVFNVLHSSRFPSLHTSMKMSFFCALG